MITKKFAAISRDLSDDDLPPVLPEKPKQKRKYVRRAAAKPKSVVPKSSPYAGTTEVDCPLVCTLTRCIITETNHCAHPLKGGLQSAEMVGDGADGRIRRYNEVKRILAGRKLDIAGQ